MIRKYAEAKVLHDAFMKADAEIKEAIDRIWNDVNCMERKRLCAARQLISGEIYVEGLRPLEHQHPMLIPEDRRFDPA